MVDALRAIHAALVAGGIVVDTQPVPSRPVVEGDAGELGTLDMREWADLIRAIDGRIASVVDAGLFTVVQESWLTITDEFDDGAEFLSTVSQWVGTRIPAALEQRAELTRGPVNVRQQIRMRLLRRL
ncbi:MAG TPA: hypothetical protein VFL73_01120 [Solirubrobacteraceae bacterium]|nr:hypothetical protein [Solirubrobacteraceae bacterium]